MAAIERRTSAWLWLSALSLGVSLPHALIDWHIGLFGASSTEMSAPQAGLVLLFGLVAAWWALAPALASQGKKSALVSLLVRVIGFALLANGVAVLAARPPPCGGREGNNSLQHNDAGSVVHHRRYSAGLPLLLTLSDWYPSIGARVDLTIRRHA